MCVPHCISWHRRPRSFRPRWLSWFGCFGPTVTSGRRRDGVPMLGVTLPVCLAMKDLLTDWVKSGFGAMGKLRE